MLEQSDGALTRIEWLTGEVRVDWDIVQPSALAAIGIKSERPVRFSDLRVSFGGAAPEPLAWWVRHPHLAGLATAAVIVALGLLLSGCECGVGWPCPR